MKNNKNMRIQQIDIFHKVWRLRMKQSLNNCKRIIDNKMITQKLKKQKINILNTIKEYEERIIKTKQYNQLQKHMYKEYLTLSLNNYQEFAENRKSMNQNIKEQLKTHEIEKCQECISINEEGYDINQSVLNDQSQDKRMIINQCIGIQNYTSIYNQNIFGNLKKLQNNLYRYINSACLLFNIELAKYIFESIQIGDEIMLQKYVQLIAEHRKKQSNSQLISAVQKFGSACIQIIKQLTNVIEGFLKTTNQQIKIIMQQGQQKIKQPSINSPKKDNIQNSQIILINKKINLMSSIVKQTIIKQKMNLIILNLRFNNISSIEKLKGCHQLQELDLSFNKIKQIQNVKVFKKLEKLKLQSNQIKYIKELEGMESLKALQLSFNCIEKIEGLEDLINLKGLSLSFNNIKQIEGLDKNIHLQQIYLNSNQLTSINNMSHLKNLKHIDLNYNKFTKDISNQQILNNLINSDNKCHVSLIIFETTKSNITE